MGGKNLTASLCAGISQPQVSVLKLSQHHSGHTMHHSLCRGFPAYHTVEPTESCHSGKEPWLPAYMPNVMYRDIHDEETQSASGGAAIIKGLAFVAVRDIKDEEILLNYRLNPQVQKPAWYSPVDLEEDARRWY